MQMTEINVIELNLEQGSEEWIAHRRRTYNASELAAAMGISPYISRNDLIRVYATGTEIEYSNYVQNVIFPNGHRVEKLIRAMVERKEDEDFIPKCFVLDGLYACSLDGQNIIGDTNLEIKQYNKELFESVSNGVLPDYHAPQVQQGLWITGCERAIFAVSTEDETDYVSIIVLRNEDFIRDIPRIWERFSKDKETFDPSKYIETYKGDPVEALPALVIHATGGIISDNMGLFELALNERLEFAKSIVYVTDKDFANAKEIAKNLREGIDNLRLVKQGMLDQTVTVGEASRTIDNWCEQMRLTALQLEKDVKRNDEIKKTGIINDGKVRFSDHIAELQKGLSVKLNIEQPDFVGAIKNKRTYESMQKSVDDLVANSILAADKIASDYKEKINWCKSEHDGYGLLFADMQIIITKQMDDFKLLINTRVSDHKEAERVKAEQASKEQAEREERIRKEAADQALAAAEKQPEPEIIASAAASDQPTKLSPAEREEAVIDHHDVIGEFIRSRSFGKEENKIRAVLVEFVKFQAEFGVKKAA